jgi:hypothetical protein
MRAFLEFTDKQEARDYRRQHGTGGWIFSPDGGGPVYLFPPDMPPTAIMNHRLTKGLSGDLIGHG